MRATRRNVLVILGVLTIAGGALFGTGAFTQVEAQRSVSVDVADDSTALVGLEANSSYVSQDANGAIEIDLSNDQFNSAQGVNTNATTTINGAFTITNNADQAITLNGPWQASSGNVVIELQPASTSLASGATTDVDVVVTTDGASSGDSLDDSVTIQANG